MAVRRYLRYRNLYERTLLENNRILKYFIFLFLPVMRRGTDDDPIEISRLISMGSLKYIPVSSRMQLSRSFIVLRWIYGM